MKKQNKKGFTLVEIMIVVVIIGLLAAMAVPAFQKVRKTSQDKAITNNLRQLASGASQYFIESGLPTGTYADIVGAGKYVKAMKPVAGEDYTGLVISEQTESYTVTKANGETVVYDF